MVVIGAALATNSREMSVAKMSIVMLKDKVLVKMFGHRRLGCTSLGFNTRKERQVLPPRDQDRLAKYQRYWYSTE